MLIGIRKQSGVYNDENERLKREIDALKKILDEITVVPRPIKQPRILSRTGRYIGETLGSTRLGAMLGGPSGLGLVGSLAGSTSGRYLTLKEREELFRKHYGDKYANTIEQAEKETDTSPSEAQIEAGNYKKGKFRWQGMEISIENPKGSYREGTSGNGKKWRNKIHHTYGYIKGTVGKDKDHVDVFIGDNLESGKVYIINQVNPETKKFDEHKVMIGFDNKEDAKRGYLKNYEEGWGGLGDISIKTVEEFKEWINGGDMSKAADKIAEVLQKNKETIMGNKQPADYIRRIVREHWVDKESKDVEKNAGLKRIMRLQAAAGKGRPGVSDALRRALGKQDRRARTFSRKLLGTDTDIGRRQYSLRTMDSAAVHPRSGFYNPPFVSPGSPGINMQYIREDLPRVGPGGSFKRY